MHSAVLLRAGYLNLLILMAGSIIGDSVKGDDHFFRRLPLSVAIQHELRRHQPLVNSNIYLILAPESLKIQQCGPLWEQCGGR